MSSFVDLPDKPDKAVAAAAEALALGLADDQSGSVPAVVPSGMPIAITGEPTYDIYVRHKTRVEGFRIHRNTAKTELVDLLRETFNLESGSVVLRHNGSVMSMSAMAPNSKDDPYVVDIITGTGDRPGTRKNSNLRRYTVEDKLAVVDPGNKHYKNEQNVLRWGKENLKDMGAPLIHLAVAIRLCRYLRTLQSAFNLNLLGVSLADLQRESLQAFVREAARYLKGESKRTRKLDEARITLIRQNAPGNSVLKIFEQLNNILRKESPAAGMPEDAELAMLAARVRTLLDKGCERAPSHPRAQISIRPDGVPSVASRGLEMPAVLSSAISAIPGLVPH